MQGIVEQFLFADDERFFLGELPPEKQQNARDAFLKLWSDELLLFFYDWSYWQNAKTGFVITNQRVLWKCMLTAPVTTHLHQMTHQNIGAEKSVLHVNDNCIDIEDEDLAAAFAQVLREICVAMRKKERR